VASNAAFRTLLCTCVCTSWSQDCPCLLPTKSTILASMHVCPSMQDVCYGMPMLTLNCEKFFRKVVTRSTGRVVGRPCTDMSTLSQLYGKGSKI
jgi:hypothetical protein